MRAMSRAESGADEEFLQRLSRGGELLAAGKVIEAKEHLEAAHRLQPRNEKSQNLLGLCYFKLGLLDRAAEIYELLVRDNPVDATLRVNLGLVYLKSSSLQRAVREFETATDLAPEHAKAHNYLGLALAQAGEYGRAREHFVLAGSEAMAEKMARAIAGEGFARTAPSSPTPPPPAAPLTAAATRVEDSWGAQFGLEQDSGATAPAEQAQEDGVLVLQVEEAEATPAAVDPELDFTGVGEEDAPAAPGGPPAPVSPWAGAVDAAAEALRDAAAASDEGDDGWAQEVPELPEALAVPETPAMPEAWPSTPPEAPAPRALVKADIGSGQARWAAAPREEGGVGPGFAELARSLQLLPQPSAEPFCLLEGALALRVQGELLTRLAGLLAVEGQVELQPERRRQRGRPVEQPFGSGAQQLVRARGEGVLYLVPPGPILLPVELGEESAYFLEEAVFAFEENVLFENGRMTAPEAPELSLVHLRGAGRVLLQLAGPLRAVAVGEGRPVGVPLSHLVGWQGEVAPRLVAAGAGLPGRVELSGRGFALLSLAGR